MAKEFNEIIKEVCSNEKLKPDLMKSENGNNFRAISESAILDVIDPILKDAGWFYTVEIKKSDLQIREAYSAKGKKLQFIATVEIALIFNTVELACHPIRTESVGMGIDDNDKAMGKAYTYAVKYALLKLFRLRYGDDSDFEASQPLLTEKKEVVQKEAPAPKKEKKPEGKVQLMSEKQRDYILGMLKTKHIEEAIIIGKFHVEPSRDEDISMIKAREIIKYLEEYKIEDDDLPF